MSDQPIQPDPTEPGFQSSVDHMADADDMARAKFVVAALGHTYRALAPLLQTDEDALTTAIHVGELGSCMTTTDPDTTVQVLLTAVREVLQRDDAVTIQDGKDYERLTDMINEADDAEGLPTFRSGLENVLDAFRRMDDD